MKIVLSVGIGFLLFMLLKIYKNKKQNIHKFLFKHSKISDSLKLSGMILFVFIVIYNWDSIIAFLKYKTTPSWFSAFGTISAVIIALLPKLKQTSDLYIDFEFGVVKGLLKGKIKISNVRNRLETVLLFTNINYFLKDPNSGIMNRVKLKPDAFTYKAVPVPAYGDRTTEYYSAPLYFKLNYICSKNLIVVFETHVFSTRDHKSYWDFSIYQGTISRFKLIDSYETVDKNTGISFLRKYYHIKY